MNARTLFIGLATAAFSALALAQAPIVIKFSHVVATDTPKGKAPEFFARRAAELTKGRAKVEVYANSVLEMVRKSGKTAIYVPTREEKMAFKKAMLPVHSKMADRVGKDLLQAIYKETGFDPTKL